MKLDFVCIGTQKSGTTKLHEIFKKHPFVFLPEQKEAIFFEIEERFKRGIDYFFKTFYSNYKFKESLVGLFDPNLELDTLYVKRIIDHFPKVKLIFILRNPVIRAYSHYRMSSLRGYETNDFKTALALEKNRLKYPEDHHQGYITKVKGHFERMHFGYITRGLYYELLQFLKENVKESNYKVVLFEDFVDNMEDSVSSICDFLEIPEFAHKIDTNKSNQSREVRFTSVNVFLKNSWILTKFKKFVPSRFRKKVKIFIKKMNSKNSTRKNDLCDDTKRIIYDKYFKEEIKKIELDFKLNLAHWKY